MLIKSFNKIQKKKQANIGRKKTELSYSFVRTNVIFRPDEFVQICT